MKWTHIIWDGTAAGNVEHVEAHDLTTDDVEYVLEHPESTGRSRTSDRPCVFGHISDGRYVVVIYEEVSDTTVLPVTAYEVPEP
jgi:hypothetical protein